MKTIKILFYVLATALIIFGNYGCSNNGNKKPVQPINVIVVGAKTYNDNQEFEYSGTMEESESIPLSFSQAGSITKVLVSEGDFVKKGQLLAVLNNTSYKNAYEMALASKKRAEDAYKRLLPMYNHGNLPEIKLVEAKTGVQQTKSAAAIAKKSLDDCDLYSPTAGMVGRRSVEPGMNVMPGAPVINIVKIKKIYAVVPVAENEISSIQNGDKARITIAALNNDFFIGIVEKIGVIADPIAHTYKIKIEIENRNNEIKPGMICSAIVYVKNYSKHLVVPSQSVLIDEQGRNFVYVIDTVNNKALRKNIKIGKLVRTGIEVISGISPGEKVVVAGQQKLVNGAPVHIINGLEHGKL